ncbi:hypothetical protein PH586_12430 [Pseudomonas sp. SA3-5]|uniref:Uncharacterized protein n=1 Tax=Pseudomonas aestuarii TaxID=3018340 RepID=A0ABT4XG40_9PSED|nr:hypothetical protein [Pseudomonas aestuarii]MDA7087191.1 hypothetical protein [Pseudomonas aestuarii]
MKPGSSRRLQLFSLDIEIRERGGRYAIALEAGGQATTPRNAPTAEPAVFSVSR